MLTQRGHGERVTRNRRHEDARGGQLRRSISVRMSATNVSTTASVVSQAHMNRHPVSPTNT